MQLTHEQMLVHWRRARGLESLRAGATLEYAENIDQTVALAVGMRQWYLALLDTGPLPALCVTDIATRLVWEKMTDNTWRTRLAPDVRRIVDIAIDGQNFTVDITPATSADPVDPALANNPYTRRLARCRAWLSEGFLWLYRPLADTPPSSITVNAIVDPGEELYVMDESALGLLPKPPEGGAPLTLVYSP